MKFKITSAGLRFIGEVLFDDEDTMKLFGFRWYISKRNERTFYAVARCNKNHKLVYMHHLILPAKNRLVIDHINRNGLDNRKCNLRLATMTENLRNRPPRNGKKYKGVYFDRRPLKKPWLASLNTIKFGNIHIGRFKTELEAAKAYNKVAWEYFEDPYALNRIEE